MLFKAFAIILCFEFINAITEVRQCKPATPAEVQYGDCLTAPCPSPRGTNITITMDFVAEDNFDSVVSNIYVIMGALKNGYPGLDLTNACSNIYSMPDKTPVGCPIEKGKSYQYILPFPIKSSFPKISANVHFGVKDKASNRNAACFETTIKVV